MRGEKAVNFNFPDSKEKIGYSLQAIRQIAADPQKTHTRRAKALVEIAQHALDNQPIRQDSFPRPRRSAPPDPAQLDPDTATAVRHRHSDQRLFQDWETFQSRFGVTSRSTPEEVRQLFRLWGTGRYTSSPGRTSSLAASSRVPDIEALHCTTPNGPNPRHS